MCERKNYQSKRENLNTPIMFFFKFFLVILITTQFSDETNREFSLMINYVIDQS